jgi:glycine oxidase
VGGGIAGLTVALAAAGRGLTVVVIDEPRDGAASRASAGILAPSPVGLPSTVRAIAIEARDYYPRFLEELRVHADLERAVTLDRNGIIEVVSTEEQLASLHARAPEGSQLIDRDLLRQLEPALSKNHIGALVHPTDGSVDNVTLMTTLDVAVARERHIRRIQDSVASLDFSGGHGVAWTSQGTHHESSVIVLASGAWASGLPGLPRALPVRPVRGQLMRLDRLPIRHVTLVPGGYLVPRAESLLIGATHEEAGFQADITHDGLTALSGIARRAIPELEGARVAEHWAGLRPSTPDGLPILGADPDLPALVYACGFSKNGILLAPWAATQLARVLSGEPAPESLAFFSPGRFEGGLTITNPRDGF